MDYTAFLSENARRMKINRLREIYSLYNTQVDDLIAFTGGLPNEETFLVESMKINLKDGTSIDIGKQDMATGQQYWKTTGLDPFADILRTLVHREHSPPCWDKSPEEGKTVVLPTCGATDANDQVFELLFSAGDRVIMENNSYPGPICLCMAKGVHAEGVQTDKDGMVIESLRSVLSKWDPKATPGSTDKPKLMYIIPNGQNPTGVTYSLERKQQIYEVAREYNVIIYEDDAYHHVTFEENVPSFLALDTDGRVLRADTFSKSLGAGFRAGYLSGPEPLMNKILLRLAVTSFGTSAMSQTLIFAIINKLGVDGFIEHKKRTSLFYKNQRDMLISSVKKWLTDLVDYDVPQSGMFLWLKVRGVRDTKDLMLQDGLKAGVICTPGEFFSPVYGRDSSYIRVSFSWHSAELFDKGCSRLAGVIKEYLRKQGSSKDS